MRRNNRIGLEVNEIENRKTIEKIHKTKSWFFEKVNKIDKPLATLTKQKRDKIQITKIRNERGYIITNLTKIFKKDSKRIL